MKISDFVSSIEGGMARTNRFTVMMNLPRFVTEGSTLDNETLKRVFLFCDTAQLPQLSVNTSPTRTYGEVREMPYEMNFDNITLTFYVDANMTVKQIFDSWIQGIQVGNTRNFRYYDDYTTDIQLFVQDLEDSNRYIVAMFEAYPKAVSAVQMDYASRDVMKVNVTFQYKWWRSQQIAKQQTDNVNYDALFDQETDDYTSGYFTQFADYQRYVNANFDNIFSEGLGEVTGLVDAYF